MTARWKCLKFCRGFSKSVTGKVDITKEVISTVDHADLIAYQKWNEFTCFTSVGIKLCVEWEIHYEILWLHCMCLNLVAYDADCTNWATYADQHKHPDFGKSQQRTSLVHENQEVKFIKQKLTCARKSIRHQRDIIEYRETYDDTKRKEKPSCLLEYPEKRHCCSCIVYAWILTDSGVRPEGEYRWPLDVWATHSSVFNMDENVQLSWYVKLRCRLDWCRCTSLIIK